MKLFHGSPEESFVPKFGLGNDEHDYGRGFYTTAIPELAREWAVGMQNAEVGWLHAYDVDFDGLKVFDFTESGVLAWIAYDVALNPIVRTFSSLLAEAT